MSEEKSTNKLYDLLLNNRKLLFSVFVVILGFIIFLMIFGTYWYALRSFEEQPEMVKEFDVSMDKLIDLFYAFIALVSLIVSIFTGGNYGEHREKRMAQRSSQPPIGGGGSDIPPIEGRQ